MSSISFIESKLIRAHSASSLISPESHILSKHPIKQIGNYSLGSEIGSGAFGKVILGHSLLTHDPVAIKILDKLILSQTPEDLSLVQKEISILKIVKHKYIVQLYEILEDAYSIYIIMEYCEGKDLMDNIITKGHLTEIESLKLFQQLINTLLYLHSQNITHRDIKIDNMLLDRNGDLKLVDFGLSTKYKDNELLNQPCGTVVYAAPEVLQGKEYHGMLCDIWSSGIVLFGMLSGYLPFSDTDDEINKQNVLKGVIDYPNFFSPLAKNLIQNMLEVNPFKRYTLKDVMEHQWFNLFNCRLIPGIIVGYNKIPFDDNIADLCLEFGYHFNDIKKSVLNNLFNEFSAIYYLIVRKKVIEGFHSVSDLFSEKFVNFILDENNVVLDFNKSKYFNQEKNEEEKNSGENIINNNNINGNKKNTRKVSGVIGAIRNFQNYKKSLSNKNSSDFSETLDSNIRRQSKEFTKNSPNQISLKSDTKGKDEIKKIIVNQRKYEEIKCNSVGNNNVLNDNNIIDLDNKKNIVYKNKNVLSRNFDEILKKNEITLCTSIEKSNNTFSKDVKNIINKKIKKIQLQNNFLDCKLIDKKNYKRNRNIISEFNNTLFSKTNKSNKNNSREKKIILKHNILNNNRNNSVILTSKRNNSLILFSEKRSETILKKGKKCKSSDNKDKNKRIIKPFSNALNSNKKNEKKKINILQNYEQNSLIMKNKVYKYKEFKTFNYLNSKRKDYLNKSNLSIHKNTSLLLNSNIISPSINKRKKKLSISNLNYTNTNPKYKKKSNDSLIDNKEILFEKKYKEKINKTQNKIEKKLHFHQSNSNNKIMIETEYLPSIINKKKDNKIKKNTNPNKLNISCITYRKKSPLTYRDISDSPKQKILNAKTRLMRIPWKIKKDGIDKNLDNKRIFSNYIKKLDNKIKKKPKNLSNIRIKSSIESSFYYPQNSIDENIKKHLEKNNLRIIQTRNKNKINVSTSLSNESNKHTNNNLINYTILFYNGPIDFMCISNENNIHNCILYLIEKFKKNNINYIKMKFNKFRCSKNGNNCEIEIYQIDNCIEKNYENLFYYKINCKKDSFLSYRTFVKVLFE